MHNNEEMALGIPSSILMQERSYEDSVGQGTPQGNMKLFHAKIKVNTCTVCETGLFTEEDVCWCLFVHM